MTNQKIWSIHEARSFLLRNGVSLPTDPKYRDLEIGKVQFIFEENHPRSKCSLPGCRGGWLLGGILGLPIDVFVQIECGCKKDF